MLVGVMKKHKIKLLEDKDLDKSWIPGNVQQMNSFK